MTVFHPQGGCHVVATSAYFEGLAACDHGQELAETWEIVRMAPNASALSGL